MIELLILFELNRRTLTMYGISKEIKDSFAVMTTPSFGTIKPALRRLESGGFVKTQKTMSPGGRPSTYYSITKEGLNELKNLIMSPPQDNPVQFLTTARIKLACADILDKPEQIELIRQLQIKTESLLIDTENMIKEKELAYYPKMVFDNLVCEYKNFVSLLEGFKKCLQ